MKQARYAPRGTLALRELPDGRAEGFGEVFTEAPLDPLPGGKGPHIISINGMLMKDAHPVFESFSAIRARVGEAVDARPSMIILKIDSPGGLVSGCFECARRMRVVARAAGVPMVAFVDGMATSAAYALASAADRIVATQTAIIGSVGVIKPLVDATRADEMQGLAVEFITSGKRKADGQASAGISDGVRDAAQRIVDQQAQAFFELIEELREIPAADVQGLEAGVFTGPDALALGLIDELGNLDSLLATFASPTDNMAEDKDIMPKMSEIEKALRAAAEGEDEEEAKKAKAMLKAGFGDEDEESKSADEDEESKAQDDEDEESKSKAAEDEDDKAKATRAVAIQALAEVQTIRAEQAAEKLSVERADLLASRPDFSDDLRAILADPKTSISVVRKNVKSIKRPPGAAELAASGTTIETVRGDTQGQATEAAHVTAAFDALLPTAQTSFGVKRDGNRQIFGVAVDS